LSKLQLESEKLRDQLGELAELKNAQVAFDKQEQLRIEREDLLRRREKNQQELARANEDRATQVLTLERLETARRALEQNTAALQSRMSERAATVMWEVPALRKLSVGHDEAPQLEQRRQRLQREQTTVHTRIATLRNTIMTLEDKLVRAGEMRTELDEHRRNMAVA